MMETLQTIFSYSGFMVVPLSIGIFVMIYRQRKLIALKDHLISQLTDDLNVEKIYNITLTRALEKSAESLKEANALMTEIHAKVDKLFPKEG